MEEREEIIMVDVDRDIKEEAERVLNANGMDLSKAINLFLTFIASKKELPMFLLVPNDETIKALRDKVDSKSYKSAEELFLDILPK